MKNIIEHEATTKLLEMQKLMQDKADYEQELVEEIRETYPLIESIQVSDTSLNVKTKKFSCYISLWASEPYKAGDPEPTMECGDMQDMPKTTEEFQIMLENMEEQKRQVIEVYHIMGEIFSSNYRHLKKLYEEDLKQMEQTDEVS